MARRQQRVNPVPGLPGFAISVISNIVSDLRDQFAGRGAFFQIVNRVVGALGELASSTFRPSRQEIAQTVTHELQAQRAADRVQHQIETGETTLFEIPISSRMGPGVRANVQVDARLGSGLPLRTFHFTLDLPPGATPADIEQATMEAYQELLGEYEIPRARQLDPVGAKVTKIERG